MIDELNRQPLAHAEVLKRRRDIAFRDRVRVGLRDDSDTRPRKHEPYARTREPLSDSRLAQPDRIQGHDHYARGMETAIAQIEEHLAYWSR